MSKKQIVVNISEDGNGMVDVKFQFKPNGKILLTEDDQGVSDLGMVFHTIKEALEEGNDNE